MFENDYTINGKHATYLKYLVNEAKVFLRYIDVFMNAALVGFLYGRSEQRDTSSQDRARIYADAFSTEKRQCDFIYRLIMLLDNNDNLTHTERLDRAFRNDTQLNTDETKAKHYIDMQMFYSYVFGGIEVLYEQFTSGASNREDYINKIYDITANFKEEIEGISYEDKLKELVKSN